jgi:hypothetical protein
MWISKHPAGCKVVLLRFHQARQVPVPVGQLASRPAHLNNPAGAYLFSVEVQVPLSEATFWLVQVLRKLVLAAMLGFKVAMVASPVLSK